MAELSPLESSPTSDISLADRLSALEQQFAAREPSVQAFIPEAGRFDRLRREANEMDRVISYRAAVPSLLGMAVGAKDIFLVDGFPTQAGSRLPAAEFQGAEAECVSRLKHEGALIIGKTVTTEFAYFTPGPTRNPRNLEHTPGGSSSGSAAAVAAGMCTLALGTQTIGSIIRPAAFCGVIGFKPTYDRIPRAGVIPLSPSLDHVGFFASSIETAIRAAQVLISDFKPWTSDRLPTLSVPDGPYLAYVSAEGRRHFDRVCEMLSSQYSIRSVPVL
ncbi:MAG: amidase family protein, partial [Anaerolineae bacterium]